MIQRKRSYGLGDAQVDAQNNATAQIGVVLDQYNNVKASGGLSAAYIQSAISQINNIIANYDSAWNKTGMYASPRGANGSVTLHDFVNNVIFPGMNADLSGAPSVPLSLTTQNDITSGNPNVPYVPQSNIRISLPLISNSPGTGTSPAYSGNPSDTPLYPNGDASEPAIGFQWPDVTTMILIAAGALLFVRATNRR